MPPRRRRAAPGAPSSTSIHVNPFTTIHSHLVAPDQPTSSMAQASDDPAEDNCSICLDALASKRLIKLLPCDHQFHRTCAIHWFESRTNRSKQVCPLCRKRTFDVREGVFSRKNFYFPFKDQEQPTRRFIFRIANALNEASIPTVISYLKEKNRSELIDVRFHNSVAASNFPTSFLNDINEEIQKLEKRDLIYRQMLKVFRAGGMRKDLLTVMEWNYPVERRLLAVNWADHYSQADAAVDYLSDSDFDFDRDEDEDAVDARHEHESAVESEYNAYRANLRMKQNQVPTPAQSRTAAVAAGVTNSAAVPDANEDTEDPVSEDEDDQARVAADAAVGRIIVEEKAEADIASRVRQRLLDSPRPSSDDDLSFERDIADLDRMRDRLRDIQDQSSAVYDRRREAISAARDRARVELTAIRERRSAELSEVRQRRRAELAAIRATGRAELAALRDERRAQFDALTTRHLAANAAPARPRRSSDHSPDRSSISSLQSFSTISSVSSMDWNDFDDDIQVLPIPPVRREQRPVRSASEIDATYQEITNRLAAVRRSLGMDREAVEAEVAAVRPMLQAATRAAAAGAVAATRRRTRPTHDSDSDEMQPQSATRQYLAELREALAISSSSEDESAVAVTASLTAANRRRRRPLNDADSDAQQPPARRRQTRWDVNVPASAAAAVRHGAATDAAVAAWRLSSAQGSNSTAATVAAAAAGAQTRRRTAASSVLPRGRGGRGRRPAQ